MRGALAGRGLAKAVGQGNENEDVRLRGMREVGGGSAEQGGRSETDIDTFGGSISRKWESSRKGSPRRFDICVSQNKSRPRLGTSQAIPMCGLTRVSQARITSGDAARPGSSPPRCPIWDASPALNKPPW